MQRGCREACVEVEWCYVNDMKEKRILTYSCYIKRCSGALLSSFESMKTHPSYVAKTGSKALKSFGLACLPHVTQQG
jgi:hypothetical protein